MGPAKATNQAGRDLATAAVLAVVYFGTAKLCLRLALVNPSATAVWAPTGIALAAFLIFGFGVWPGIFMGAFLANITTSGTILTSIGVATGNTLEGVLGCYLVGRFARGQHVFERAQDIFKFVFFAGMVSTMISATIGVTTLSLGGFASWTMYGPIWRTWWLGDGVGAVAVTPLVLLWRENPHLNWTREQIIEVALLFLGLFVHGLDCIWRAFSLRGQKLSAGIPLRSILNLGGVPLRPPRKQRRRLACWQELPSGARCTGLAHFQWEIQTLLYCWCKCSRA